MNRFVRIGISLFFLAACILLFGAVEKARVQKRCENLQVEVDHSTGIYFLHKEDIREFLKDREDSLIGKAMTSIGLRELEAELRRIPAVRKAEAYQELDGTLRVSVRQRQPIARFIDREGLSYYWDRKGERMPLSDAFTPRVPVVTGHFEDTPFSGEKAESKRKRLRQLLHRMEKDSFWNKQIQELHFNEKGELEFVPLVGNHRVIFGELKDLENKLQKLRIFYREASEHTGLDHYDTLDLRFGDQVVGKKKDHGGT